VALTNRPSSHVGSPARPGLRQLPVVAGPVEATALGNVLIRARTLGAAGDHLAEAGLNRDVACNACA
jgi:hypothetical protein